MHLNLEALSMPLDSIQTLVLAEPATICQQSPGSKDCIQETESTAISV